MIHSFKKCVTTPSQTNHVIVCDIVGSCAQNSSDDLWPADYRDTAWSAVSALKLLCLHVKCNTSRLTVLSS